jgi:hypothetical protein
MVFPVFITKTMSSTPDPAESKSKTTPDPAESKSKAIFNALSQLSLEELKNKFQLHFASPRKEVMIYTFEQVTAIVTPQRARFAHRPDYTAKAIHTPTGTSATWGPCGSVADAVANALEQLYVQVAKQLE